jgi:DNA-binding transcriptional LysR family regulator
MELRHLRYFTAVAAELSFSRAAVLLHIAQPPLSRQIRQLEEELGAELFDRSVRPLRLTPAGKFFQGQAKTLLERAEQAQAETRRIARGQSAWFNIGFVPSLMYSRLPEVIRRFRQANPEVVIGLSEMTTLEQREALTAGRIDVGFGRIDLEDPRLLSREMAREAIIVALPSGHRLASRKRLTLETLAPEPLLLYPSHPRPSYADEVLEMFRSRSLQPQVALDLKELQTVIGLVATGIGYALVPASVRALQREGVTYLPLRDADLHSPIIMNWRVADDSALSKRFFDAVAQTLAAAPSAA